MNILSKEASCHSRNYVPMLVRKQHGLPQGLSSKESACNAGDEAGASALIPGLRRSPGKGNGNLIQYSCPENSMDRGVWWATVHGDEVSDTTKRLSARARTHTHTHTEIRVSLRLPGAEG